MIWSGDPQFRHYEHRARAARAKAVADVLAAVRQGLTRGLARSSLRLWHSLTHVRPTS